MTAPSRPSAPHLGRPLRRARRGDGGFTFIELLVAMAVLAIIVPVIYGLIGNLSQQSVDLHDTMLGLKQDQTAGNALLEYLHGAVTVLPGSTPTTLIASIEAGYNTTTGTQDIATLEAQLVPPSGSNADASFVVSITPQGGTPHPIGTYYVVNGANPFTYYYYAAAGTAAPSCGATTPTTTTNPPDATGQELVAVHDPCAVLANVVAVGVDVTFLAGPQKPLQGFQAIQPTTFQTTVYLQNANAPAPTTATAVTYPNISPTYGTTVAFTVTVTPAPDGGTVTAVVTFGGSTISNSCSGATTLSATGQASCSFFASYRGTYTVTATYSGATSPPAASAYTASTSAGTPVNAS
ncbi:MAG: prepilin-type N-terminal cleavage/methylation domain-containing protein [Actinomycetota bacterium]|nr:prepilin-type N-terminal cleavage/methylation domain-containing protein [Actinomycetota bacterium]